MCYSHIMNMEMDPYLQCPRDGSLLEAIDGGSRCSMCQSEYQRVDKKIFFVPPQNTPSYAGGNVHAKNPKKWTTWRRSNHEFFAKILGNFKANSLVIDLGVGDAQFSDIVQQKFHTVIGLDFAPYPDADVICNIIGILPIKDNSCDIVFASNVFEHIPYPLDTLRECARILKPGGMIVGATPFLLDIHQAPYDFNRYTNFMWERLLIDTGFHEISVISLGTPRDALRNMQLHFFYKLYRHLKEQRRGLAYFFAKVIWNCIKLCDLLIAKFLPMPSIPEFTQGYGFSAKKMNRS